MPTDLPATSAAGEAGVEAEGHRRRQPDAHLVDVRHNLERLALGLAREYVGGGAAVGGTVGRHGLAKPHRLVGEHLGDDALGERGALVMRPAPRDRVSRLELGAETRAHTEEEAALVGRGDEPAGASDRQVLRPLDGDNAQS
eukprot:scaffold59454_cov17-Tisochrysis_lutea.AAC.2